MYDQRRLLYQKIEKFTKSSVISFVLGDRQNLEIQIAADALEHFVDHLDAMPKTERISLIIHSRGGNTLAGWSLVNLIRQFCDQFHVIIPARAHSTATLIALGANSIMMTKQATLGPIDPSVNGPLNPPAPGPNPLARIPVSVESINGYLEFAKNVGIQNESEMAGLVLDLASRINPVVLGNVFRSRSQIRMLGRRLMAAHMQDARKVDKILDFLCSESGSHDYTIDRTEARIELGLNIKRPNDAQYKIVKGLHDDYTYELELRTPYDPNVLLGADPEKDYAFSRGLIESVNGGSTKFITRGKLTRKHVGQPPQLQELIEDRRTFEGWTNG